MYCGGKIIKSRCQQKGVGHAQVELVLEKTQR